MKHTTQTKMITMLSEFDSLGIDHSKMLSNMIQVVVENQASLNGEELEMSMEYVGYLRALLLFVEDARNMSEGMKLMVLASSMKNNRYNVTDDLHLN